MSDFFRSPPKWNSRTALLVILAWCLLVVGSSLYCTNILRLTFEVSFLIGQVLALVPIVGWLAYWMRTYTITRSDIGIRKAPVGQSLFVIGLYPVLFTSVIVLGGLIVAAFLIFTDMPIPKTNDAASSPQAVVTWAAIVSGLVLAPIIEEILFRGLLFRALMSRWSTKVAAVISSLIFMLGHLGNSEIGMVGIFFVGLYLCWSYKKTGSLIPGMIVHAIHNAFVLAGPFFL